MFNRFVHIIFSISSFCLAAGFVHPSLCRYGPGCDGSGTRATSEILGIKESRSCSQPPAGSIGWAITECIPLIRYVDLSTGEDARGRDCRHKMSKEHDDMFRVTARTEKRLDIEG